MRTNADVARAVAAGDVAMGLLPVENTLAGSVAVTWDAILADESLHAVAEVVLPIHHAVLAPVGATLDELRTVESHPVALAQCRQWLERHPHIIAVGADDTAGAAAQVARAGDPTRGAIAGQHVAAHHALVVLDASIEDRADNQTRFVALSRVPLVPAAGTPSRSMVALDLEDHPGALLNALAPLAQHGLNITRFDARPTGVPWTYRLVVDFEHIARSTAFDAAMEAMARGASVRLIGTVPIATAHSANAI
jgi:prephenate dehydratase